MIARKSLLFDMGNVLVFIDEDRRNAALGAVLGLSPAKTKALLQDDGLQWRYECGRLSTDEFIAGLRAGSSGKALDAAILAAFCDMFRPHPAMTALLATLRARGHRLVVVSNTNPTHAAFVSAHFDVFAPFHARILSHEIRAMKPMPEFYAAAAEAALVAPAEALFIDDVATNVDGARGAGFAAHLYVPTPAGHADLLRELNEFAPP
jgi:putative hydrolase of the HAD superfamily